MSEANKPIIDVELLVEDIRARLEQQRAAGAYADDLSGVTLEIPPQVTDGTSSIIAAYDFDAPRVRFRPELGFSSKRVIGPVITLVKQFILRLLFFVFDDLAKQADAAIRRVEVAVAVETGARQGDAQLMDARVKIEVGAREALQSDVKALAEHLASVDNRFDRVQLEPRLARLERARRAPPAAAPADGAATPAPAFAIDYERFEDRFRPEKSVLEHQHAYVELLRDRKRVVDLGCGRGELIEMLGREGVSAYGVEIDPDFIALLEEKEIEVVTKDAVAHLDEVEPGQVDGIVASHLVEHLSAAAVSRLVALAGEKLPEGGILVVETPNPESLVAGSINFHRDLTHVRPIHPDTLAFLCESSGFPEVEIRRLSPVPDEDQLPGAGDERLDAVVEQLNSLLYGFQDYAVVARK